MNTDEIPNHFNETVFSCKRHDLLCSHSNGDIFTIFRCEDIIFSREAHLVFHWCLYNKTYYYTLYSLSGFSFGKEPTANFGNEHNLQIGADKGGETSASEQKGVDWDQIMDHMHR